MNIKQKLTSAAIIGAMMASVVAPASFAATKVKIRGNGAGSFNKVKMWKKNVNVTHQSNTTIVGTFVGIGANTGGNSANGNTGGNVDTDTGNVTNTVDVSVTGNRNTDSSQPCGCDEGNTNVTIEKNGAGSVNVVKLGSANVSWTNQSNTTVVGTGVLTLSNTGLNSANGNTGGSTTTDTGDVDNTVNVTVGGSTNNN